MKLYKNEKNVAKIEEWNTKLERVIKKSRNI
jgi:hypothetical protein